MTDFIDTFVEKITTTKIIKVIDGSLPNFAGITVVPKDNDTSINLVIGAEWEDSCACAFSKKHLGELIEVLKAIHNAMGVKE